MKNGPIRVAQMMTEMNFGGVEMVVLNYYKNIDRNKVQFDFFVLEGSIIPQRKEIENLGGKIFVVPRYTSIIQYEIEIIKLFKKNHYRIVHSHMNTLSLLSLLGAKIAGIPNRIAHNHSTAGKGETKKNIIKYTLKPFSKLFPTVLCACTQYAGVWLFGERANFTVFKNAIDLSKFKYDEAIRNKIRFGLGINDKFVIGNVGRFCYQKNQEFLICLLKEVLKREDAVLVLIGEGESEQLVRNKAIYEGVEKKVLFIGACLNVNEYYQAMDCFVLPSRYEGLGIVAVEAQTAGLPTICSTEVPKEVQITNLVKFIDLNADIKQWANALIKVNRTDRSDEVRKAGYDIETEASKLVLFYENLL